MRNANCVISMIIVTVLLASCNTNDSNLYSSHRLQWWLKEIRWDVGDRDSTITGKNVTIAVLDTAVYASHPDLIGTVVKELRIPADRASVSYEHGTAVAGIICATPSSSKGVLGIAPDASLISIDIRDQEHTTIQSLVAGIELAIEHDTDIINISLGVMADDPKLEEAIRKAIAKNIVVVAAAGNTNEVGEISYPAQYDGVIGVSSTDRDGDLLFPAHSGERLVFAPGEDIVSSYSDELHIGQYIGFSGTSLSAPMVTATIALLLEAHPNLLASEVHSYFSQYTGVLDVKKVLRDFSNTHP